MHGASCCTSKATRNGRSTCAPARRVRPRKCRCERCCSRRKCRSTFTGRHESAAMSEHSTPPPGPPRLIADIGGTNARFALLRDGKRLDEKVLACADYPDIVSAIEFYLGSVGAAKGAERP